MSSRSRADEKENREIFTTRQKSTWKNGKTLKINVKAIKQKRYDIKTTEKYANHELQAKATFETTWKRVIKLRNEKKTFSTIELSLR